ncbi:MAG: endonuclease/exonuclease/phosphatase family protein, partial [Thermotaleaceae bacterium]
MRKTVLILLLASTFLLAFSLSTTVFSEEELDMKVFVDGNGNSIVKLFAPTNIQSIYLEIYHMESRFLAGLHLNYYTIERVENTTKHVFLVNSGVLKGKKRIHFALFPGTDREEIFHLKDLEVIQRAIEMANIQEESKGIEVADSSSLKIMSFNIHHGRSRFGVYNLHNVAQIIREHNIDIVGLQEVDRKVYRSRFEDQIIKLADELGMYYVYAPNIKILGAEYGNAILSKYPIESYENITLPSKREKRGLLMSKIRVNGEEINFLVTHLGLNRQERKNQLLAIDQYIKFLGERII